MTGPSPAVALPGGAKLLDQNHHRQDHMSTHDSSMITLRMEQVVPHFQCRVCAGILNNPLVLSDCMHRFCKECIDAWFRTCISKKWQHSCPVCRVKVTSAQKSVKLDPTFNDIARMFFPEISTLDDYIDPPVVHMHGAVPRGGGTASGSTLGREIQRQASATNGGGAAHRQQQQQQQQHQQQMWANSAGPSMHAGGGDATVTVTVVPNLMHANGTNTTNQNGASGARNLKRPASAYADISAEEAALKKPYGSNGRKRPASAAAVLPQSSHLPSPRPPVSPAVPTIAEGAQLFGAQKEDVNGNEWSAFVVKSSTRQYLGTYTSEEAAGLVHDYHMYRVRGPNVKKIFNFEHLIPVYQQLQRSKLALMGFPAEYEAAAPTLLQAARGVVRPSAWLPPLQRPGHAALVGGGGSAVATPALHPGLAPAVAPPAGQRWPTVRQAMDLFNAAKAHQKATGQDFMAHLQQVFSQEFSPQLVDQISGAMLVARLQNISERCASLSPRNLTEFEEIGQEFLFAPQKQAFSRATGYGSGQYVYTKKTHLYPNVVPTPRLINGDNDAVAYTAVAPMVAAVVEQQGPISPDRARAQEFAAMYPLAASLGPSASLGAPAIALVRIVPAEDAKSENIWCLEHLACPASTTVREVKAAIAAGLRQQRGAGGSVGKGGGGGGGSGGGKGANRKKGAGNLIAEIDTTGVSIALDALSELDANADFSKIYGKGAGGYDSLRDGITLRELAMLQADYSEDLELTYSVETTSNA